MPRTIADIESGFALIADMETVGVLESSAMNAAAKVRVRNVRCIPDAPNAVCSYEASRCLPTETDSDGDGWCARTATFLRIDEERFLAPRASRGWTLDR